MLIGTAKAVGFFKNLSIGIRFRIGFCAVERESNGGGGFGIKGYPVLQVGGVLEVERDLLIFDALSAG